MESDDSRRRRAPRSPSMGDEAVAAAMLQAGQEMIREQGGLTVSMHHLSYEAVIQRAAVPRTAAYRLWSHKDQFNTELLLRIANPSVLAGTEFAPVSLTFLADLLEQSLDGLADPDRREATAGRVLGSMMARTVAGVGRTAWWRTLVNSRAAINSLPDGPDKREIVESLAATEDEFADQLAAMHTAMAAAVGLKFKSPFTALHPVRHGAVVLEGLALRRSVARPGDHSEDIDGDDEPDLTGMALAAVVRAMTEPDPDYEVRRTVEMIEGLRGLGETAGETVPTPVPTIPDLLARSVGSVAPDDAAAMSHALSEAVRAPRHGDVPVGAVVVVDGRIVAARHNEREQTGDPTAHAELLALRDAAERTGSWRLPAGARLVVTLEPCPMCAGAMLAARVTTLVFGAADPKAGACGSLYNLCADPRLHHEIEVIPGVAADQCGALLTSFFARLRETGQPGR